ncbi:hypothetical protein Sgou_53720 [Streptomyces gougerotii]|uniref:Uncharacterized protein n=1 Tax=Streptomyces gougerotii TaxID=53448 RepID=A0A8H9HGU0_9ACTN|nr:hypothetical protein Sgou_53720 [Streptomyces gougerotii]GGU62311.1 hypothetical protein GCM10010227_14570 [Streptomyces gougerotii]
MKGGEKGVGRRSGRPVRSHGAFANIPVTGAGCPGGGAGASRACPRPSGGDAWRAIRRAGAHGDRKQTGYADVSADGDTSTNTGVRSTIASGAGKTGAAGGPGRPGDPGTISRQENPS